MSVVCDARVGETITAKLGVVGNGLTDPSLTHFTHFEPLHKRYKKEWLKLYIPARSAIVLKKLD